MPRRSTRPTGYFGYGNSGRYNAHFSKAQLEVKSARASYFGTSTTGVIEAAAKLYQLLDGVEGMLDTFTLNAARRLYFKIQERVPYRTGRLAQSVRVNRTGNGKTITGFEAYAFAVNPDTGEEYAVEQHENVYYKHAPGRTHHYISIPFQKVIDDLEEQLLRNSVRIAQILYRPDAAYKYNALYSSPSEKRYKGDLSWEERSAIAKRIPHYKNSINFTTPNAADDALLHEIAEMLGMEAYLRAEYVESNRRWLQSVLDETPIESTLVERTGLRKMSGKRQGYYKR